MMSPRLKRCEDQQLGRSHHESDEATPLNVVSIAPPRPLRERGLDKTLSETFPCSDPLSSIPDPVLRWETILS